MKKFCLKQSRLLYVMWMRKYSSPKAETQLLTHISLSCLCCNESRLQRYKPFFSQSTFCLVSSVTTKAHDGGSARASKFHHQTDCCTSFPTTELPDISVKTERRCTNGRRRQWAGHWPSGQPACTSSAG